MRWLIRPALRLTLALGVAALLLHWQPIDAYAAVWRNMAAGPVLAAYGLTVPTVALRAVQARNLARVQGMAIAFRPLVELHLATSFYGLFLPGVVAAGALRWYRLAKLGGSAEATLALVTFSRLLEIEAALLLGLLFSLADPLTPGGWLLPAAFAALLVATSLARWTAFHPRVAAATTALVERHWRPRRAASLRSRVLALLGVTGRYSGLAVRAWAGLLVTVLAGQALGLLTLVLLAQAVGMEVSWVTLGWARAIVSLALLLPVTWAGIGLREATMAAALAAAGQPIAAAVTLGLLLSLRGLIEAAVGGLIELRAYLVPPRREGA